MSATELCRDRLPGRELWNRPLEGDQSLDRLQVGSPEGIRQNPNYLNWDTRWRLCLNEKATASPQTLLRLGALS